MAGGNSEPERLPCHHDSARRPSTQKFKFAGGSDVPDWLLSEVAVLSKISCVRLKLITRQVINELTGGRLDVDKVCKLAPKESGATRGFVGRLEPRASTVPPSLQALNPRISLPPSPLFAGFSLRRRVTVSTRRS